MSGRSVLTVAVAVLFVVILSASAQVRTEPTSKPESEGGISWTAGTPANYGIDTVALDSIYTAMDQEPHHDLKGIVILRDGHLVSEHYFNGDSFDTLHDIRSATKSLTSMFSPATASQTN